MINMNGHVKILRPTNTTGFHAHPMIKLIKKHAQTIRKQYNFNVVDICNILQMNPFLFIARMKDLANRLQFSFICDGKSFLY